MAKIYLGKISPKFPEQFEQNFYAAGKKGSSFYGGIEVGDYVFPIYDSSVSKLWRVKRYNPSPHEINPNGTVEFEVVKTFNEIPISAGFARYRYFSLNIVLLNKLTKSTAKERLGFYQISVDEDCPSPEHIDFNELRNIYIAIENLPKPPAYQAGDIRITLSNQTELKIKSIDIFRAGVFKPYDPLNSLYLEKNEENERYSLEQLYDYAVKDQAEKKKEYLKAVISEVKRVGYFVAGSPIGLYDNILVGRKKTRLRKKDEGDDIEDIEIEESESIEQVEMDFKEYVDLLEANPNLILYGPPGTGKTYSAQRIIEAFDYKRFKKARSFKQIAEEGRVDFVTFHQSFSYEEFIEGLRPVINTEAKTDEAQEGSNLQYKIQDGILKQIANRAELGQIKSELRVEAMNKVREDNKVWKISLGRIGIDQYIYERCIKTNTIAIGWFHNMDMTGWDFDRIMIELRKEKSAWSDNPTNDASSIDGFINQMQIGDIVLVFASVTQIRAIGVITGPYTYKKEMDEFPHRRDVKWLKTNQTIEILKYNDGRRLTMKTLYELNRIKFSDIKEMLEIGASENKQNNADETPYYLVIDEINRGNISKIFGELITLIEKDKRGRLTCKLTYSQKAFSLPSNLYIIGTMNTADRSIAVLDVALRRRFFFKEIEPDVKAIRKNNDSNIYQDLESLFIKLNAHIVNKLDRDHRIGHYHFMSIKTITDLRIVWYYQIIPLLMEYFYNDATSISDIIGDVFIDKVTLKVKQIPEDTEFMNAIRAIK